MPFALVPLPTLELAHVIGFLRILLQCHGLLLSGLTLLAYFAFRLAQRRLS